MVKSQVATFFSIFPRGVIFASEGELWNSDTVLFGEADPQPIEPDQIQQRLNGPEYRRVKESLAEVNFHRAVDLLATYAGRRAGLADLLAGRTPDLTKPQGKRPNSPRDNFILTVSARLKRVGREMRMLVENPADQAPADRGLLRIIARAHDIQLRLMQNVDLTVHEVASEEHVSAAYIYSVLRLSSLAPDIVNAIVNGRNPPQLTAKKLMRLSPHLPIDWAEQRTLLGFS